MILGHDFRRKDLTDYKFLLNHPETRDFLRPLFSSNYKNWHRRLERVVDIRHSLFHPDDLITKDQARQHLMEMVNLCREAGLGCGEELVRLLEQLDTEQPSNDQVSPEAVHAMQVQTQKILQDKQEAEGRESDAQIAREHAEAQRDKTRAELLEKQQEEKRLKEEIRQIKSAHSAETEQLLRQKEAEIRDQQRVVQEALAQVERAETARRQQEQELTEAQKHLKEQEKRILSAQARAEIAGAEARAKENTADAERLANLVHQLTQAPQHTDRGLPKPGDAWRYPRGTEQWRLSRAHHRMERLEDDLDLIKIVGPTAAKELVTRFLRIRPSGGRVWVDSDGDAVTYVDNKLVYLGRIEQPQQPGLAIGTPTTGEGRKYHLSRSGITRARDDRALKDELGQQRAREVTNRLLCVKPKGGVLRVDEDGNASLYVDGAWIHAGQIERSEWFKS